MDCFICKKEITESSPKYSDKVCLECAERFMESDNKVEAFRKQYKIDHAVCPKCNGDSHISTLAGFIINSSNLEAYMDLNKCTCMHCGDKHTTHERVAKK